MVDTGVVDGVQLLEDGLEPIEIIRRMVDANVDVPTFLHFIEAIVRQIDDDLRKRRFRGDLPSDKYLVSDEVPSFCSSELERVEAGGVIIEGSQAVSRNH